ncbi:alcohol dehydrogenase [Cladophialophora yegresii CBS 114405]|uniref:Alcohol dehydrogenase n=1 Tax=Cladophialophora yegresii CBS 114405 TaxID=1182544 RepID=W9VJ63_9EURO|nr:alcohol dehydrogenase [Cladophialophora yegresii CBS 114405]EXJ55533.1 alcohol dehydrogenase [Cladophialophora yegresii CBS 114405]
MKALVYQGDGKCGLEDRSVPKIKDPSDAIVKVVFTTICGTDTHILHGDVPTCKPGTILGHEGVGVVEEPGSGVARFKKGDHVLINCISSCATCSYCRRGMHSHCVNGGWILGHTIDGTQAEYVRIPFADSGLHHVPKGVDEKALVMLSDIFPTGLECGVQNGKVQPGSTVAIVGSGPVGLAALMTSKLYSPSLVIMIDRDPSRLKVAKRLGADRTVNSAETDPMEVVMKLTDNVGCDTVMEAVGVPETLEMAQDLVAPGGTVANVGVHGKSCVLKIEKLWSQNISLTTRLVDTVTTPMLLKLFAAGGIQPGQLITHEFSFADMEQAYTTFKAAAQHDALKMLIKV